MHKVHVERLDSSQAFGSGAQLWVVTQTGQSRWVENVDWYLNFQIFRAEARTCELPSIELKKIINDLKVPDIEFTSPLQGQKQQPTLIASLSHLPTEMILSVPWGKKLEQWVEKSLLMARRLKVSSARMFLPDRLDENDLLTDRQFERMAKAVLGDKIDFDLQLQIVDARL